jgi:hypothetical protein
VSPKSGLNAVAKRKDLLCRGSNPCYPARSLVTIVTELSHILGKIASILREMIVLMMEAAITFEASGNFYETTGLNNLDTGDLPLDSLHFSNN